MSLRISIFIFVSILANSAFGIDDSKLKTYLELLKVGCSVDTTTTLDITADGKLVILKKSKVGGVSFELNSSETQNILSALKNDALKGDQADKQRQCQQDYLDKIFNALIPEKRKEDLKKSTDGYLFELGECTRVQRNNVSCTFAITSAYYDRELHMNPHMFDNLGNGYGATSIVVANFKSHRGFRQVVQIDVSLIADVRTSGKVTFNNVHSNATGLSKLFFIEGIEFREITIDR